VSAVEEPPYKFIAAKMREGSVIPFLGAGVNLTSRAARDPADNKHWEPGEGLPSGSELAEYLADYLEKMWERIEGDSSDLAKISQYVEAKLGLNVLYSELRGLFTAEYEPNALHTLLARTSTLLRSQGRPQQLIVTTNYDYALEKAFELGGEPYDIIWYEAKLKPEDRFGKFVHRTHEGAVEVIRDAATYEIAEDRAVILKIHGAVSRADAGEDSYVITENDYIAYLARTDILNELPSNVKERLPSSNFLFLGYSLSDWNLRVILNRIWGERKLTVKSWAIQRYEKEREKLYVIERKLWDDRGDVEPYYLSLDEFAQKLDALIPVPAPAPTT
jgi:hypothetical protein